MPWALCPGEETPALPNSGGTTWEAAVYRL